jgi:hypothetical protein
MDEQAPAPQPADVDPDAQLAAGEITLAEYGAIKGTEAGGADPTGPDGPAPAARSADGSSASYARNENETGESDAGPFFCDVCSENPAEVVQTMLEGRTTIVYCMPCLAHAMLSAIGAAAPTGEE